MVRRRQSRRAPHAPTRLLRIAVFGNQALVWGTGRLASGPEDILRMALVPGVDDVEAVLSVWPHRPTQQKRRNCQHPTRYSRSSVSGGPMALVEPHDGSKPESPKTKNGANPGHILRGRSPRCKLVSLFGHQGVRPRQLCQSGRIVHEDWERRLDRNAGALRCLGCCRRGRLFGFDLAAGRTRGCRRGSGCGHRRCRFFFGPRRRRPESHKKCNQQSVRERTQPRTPGPMSCNDTAEPSLMAHHAGLDTTPRVLAECARQLTA